MTSKTTRMIMNICSFCMVAVVVPFFIHITYPLLSKPSPMDILRYIFIVAAAAFFCMLVGSILGIIIASAFKVIFKNTIFKDIL